jgi:phosphotransferase system  glucose/maltose/N-acetylglucosamine-specific IIC component
MKKQIGLLIIQWIAVAGTNITFLWGIIEYILCRHEEKEFNWWSVWSFIICVIVALLCAVYFTRISRKT